MSQITKENSLELELKNILTQGLFKFEELSEENPEESKFEKRAKEKE